MAPFSLFISQFFSFDCEIYLRDSGWQVTEISPHKGGQVFIFSDY